MTQQGASHEDQVPAKRSCLRGEGKNEGRRKHGSLRNVGNGP